MVEDVPDGMAQVGWLRVADGSFHSLERNPSPMFAAVPVYVWADEYPQQSDGRDDAYAE